MPNLPTSLILLVLAAAWLWVLVPMFARSREAVPETDDDAAGFRVLRRAGRRVSLRRSSVTDTADTDDDADTDDATDSSEGTAASEVVADADDAESTDAPVGDLVDELADADTDDAELLAAAGIRNRRDLRRLDTEQDRSPQPQQPVVNRVTDDRAERDADPTHDDDLADRPTATIPVVRADDDVDEYDDAADEWDAEQVTDRSDRSGVIPADPRRRATGQRVVRDRPPAPRAHRPGRGGFDPVQAEATARYRFRRRRLISLTLLLVAIGLGVGAGLVDDRLWVGATVSGLALVGYLAYLSRQVKIERAIRERRMARARRAREIRPAKAVEPRPVSPYRERPERPVAAAPRTGPAERPIRRATHSSHVPPSRRRGYTVVDLDDDDPAFDELERYEPVVYRRAAGQ